MPVHIALLGDSIFDNAAYTGDEPDVVTHLTRLLGAAGRTTLLALDGGVADDLREQCMRVPNDCSHLVVSVGGNDALGCLVTVCTIYNGNFPPPLDAVTRVALTPFNDVILRVAFENGLSVIDLRLVCTEASDYANPIEPSGAGGAKIAKAIAGSCGVLTSTPRASVVRAG